MAVAEAYFTMKGSSHGKTLTREVGFGGYVGVNLCHPDGSVTSYEPQIGGDGKAVFLAVQRPGGATEYPFTDRIPGSAS